MNKAQKARNLINDEWSKLLKDAVTKEFGDIGFETEYNFFSMSYVSDWRKDKSLPNVKIKEFVKGFEQGCLGCMHLMTTL